MMGTFVCMYVCMYVFVLCMYFMYVCMYICMYVCMYVLQSIIFCCSYDLQLFEGVFDDDDDDDAIPSSPTLSRAVSPFSNIFTVAV